MGSLLHRRLIALEAYCTGGLLHGRLIARMLFDRNLFVGELLTGGF
jgi:hypothetical protein